jgi:hypothetical protein
MLSAGNWRKNQQNTILFVMVDTTGQEITGLGSSFTLQISKSGAAFANSAGTKSEAGEADTGGPVAIKVTGSGSSQQNLEYVVEDRVETAVDFTYTVTTTGGGLPIEGVEVVTYLDPSAVNIVWEGITDFAGIARDTNGLLPRLQPGTYYFFSNKAGYVFTNPDTEIVS